MDGDGWKSQRQSVRREVVVMNALEFRMKYGSGIHYYFCQFANAASIPPNPPTSETSSKENVEFELVLGQLCYWEWRPVCQRIIQVIQVIHELS
jgi:hypothetical protein